MTEYVPNLNAAIVGRLSIERCQSYLAHLHALMHLCLPGDLGYDSLVAESARKLMADLESELAHSASVFNVFE